jgi:hypothetical protein
MVMSPLVIKYFVLAAVAALGAILVNLDGHAGLACGFAISAGLCIVAAAIAESKKNDKDESP